MDNKLLDLKIVVLGAACVGKTSVILRYCNDSFDSDTQSTIGASFFTHVLKYNDTDVTLMLWDTAGEERFRSVAPALLRGANGLILVYDVTQQQSFEEIGTYMEMFLDNVQVDLSSTLPVLLLGNKDDMPNQVVSKFDTERWCEKNHVSMHHRVSAKTGVGISEAILELVGTIMKKNEENNEINSTEFIRIQETKNEKKGCC